MTGKPTSNEEIAKLLEEVVKEQLEIKTSLHTLINAAREGGGLVPKVDYVKMDFWRHKYGKKLKLRCRKECVIGPCRYGPEQALKCFEMLEKERKKKKMRIFLASHIPYKNAALQEMKRSQLLQLCGVMGINLQKVFKRSKNKGQGNIPVIEAILKEQPKYVIWRDKKNKKKIKEQPQEGTDGKT
jgi:hypothetical protein